MVQTFQDIDYSDMINELTFDMSNGYVNEDSELYVIRQREQVFVEKCQGEVFPVIDYFYWLPKLAIDVKSMSILDAKKECFKALDILSSSESPNKEALTEAVTILLSDLKQYTAGNNKRNDKICKIIYTEEPQIPMMLYFDDTDAGDKLEIIKAKDLIDELKKCC